jgi:hypothetical protein
MSFLSKVELKKQLQEMGIKVEGNYVKKSDMAKLIQADNAEDLDIGNKLIEVLQLKLKPNGRVDTTWGDKTPIGLVQVVKRIIQEKGKSPSQ